MIDIHELRVGNFILLDTGFVLPSPHKVKAKDIYDISEGRITLNALEGIEITQRILESSSEKVDQYYRIDAGLSYIIFDLQDDCCIGEDTQYEVVKIKHPKYVHQLQNLYHSLTGEELAINL